MKFSDRCLGFVIRYQLRMPRRVIVSWKVIDGIALTFAVHVRSSHLYSRLSGAVNTLCLSASKVSTVPASKEWRFTAHMGPSLLSESIPLFQRGSPESG